MNNKKTNLHPKNLHNKGYDFKKLCRKHPVLNKYIFVNKHQTTTIDFANPKAVKALNTALLLTYYPINFWKFPEENLCPPIPGRVDYIHYLADLLKASDLSKDIKVLDIGTGASCIYPILGNAVYGWEFVGTDIDPHSLKSAQNIVTKNKLAEKISFREQKDKSKIFNGIINTADKLHASMCNPPFFASQEEAKQANLQKQKGLGKESMVRNFSGSVHELWYQGGEKAFLHNYLYESSKIKEQCYWFTTLVSKKENVKSMYESLEKLGATDIKTIPMQQGNKISRIVAWTFLSELEQKTWKETK